MESSRAALLVSGFVPILLTIFRGDTTLLIYSVFVAVYFAQPRVDLFRGSGRRRPLGIALAVLVCGWTAELCAWSSNYIEAAQRPALLSPQLLPDLFLAVGFYGGWALAWILATKRYEFSLRDAFVATGVMGIFVEQEGNVAVSIYRGFLTDPMLGVLLGIYVFTVYGSIIGTAHTLAVFDGPKKGKGGWTRFPLVVLGMVILSILFTAIASSAGTWLGVIHPPLPIREHPLFWMSPR